MNYKIDEDKNEVIIEINTKVYEFDIIITSIYPLIDSNYMILDGDKNGIIECKIKPKRKKEKEELEELYLEFNNRLLTQLIHRKNMEENKEIVDTIYNITLKEYNDQIKKNDIQ